MKEERINLVEAFINQRGIVTIPELCDKFNVSVNTVRRDLNTLEQQGKIQKVYGGAKRLDPSAEASGGGELLRDYSDRIVRNSDQKIIIAKTAASFIQEGDTIFIDTGTSTVPLVDYIPRNIHLTIVSNSIYVLSRALSLVNATIIGLPGTMKFKTASLVGVECYQMLERYTFNKAFMACSSISLQQGISNSSQEEFQIKRRVLERSQEHFLLVDSSKFDKTALLGFAKPEDFDYIISEKNPPQKYLDYFKEYKIHFITPDVSVQ